MLQYVHISAIECLRGMGVPWKEECTKAAVPIGDHLVPHWTLKHGAPIHRATVLDASIGILHPSSIVSVPVSRFKAM